MNGLFPPNQLHFNYSLPCLFIHLDCSLNWQIERSCRIGQYVLSAFLWHHQHGLLCFESRICTEFQVISASSCKKIQGKTTTIRLKLDWYAHSTCASWSFSDQHFSIFHGNQVSDLISFVKQVPENRMWHKLCELFIGLPAAFEPHENNIVDFSCGVLERGIITSSFFRLCQKQNVCFVKVKNQILLTVRNKKIHDKTSYKLKQSLCTRAQNVISDLFKMVLSGRYCCLTFFSAEKNVSHEIIFHSNCFAPF